MYQKSDLCTPTIEELAAVFEKIEPQLGQLRQDSVSFKLIGGYALQRLGSRRSTRDIDIALNITGRDNIADALRNLGKDFQRLKTGGYAYDLHGDGSRLIPIDFVDARTFRSLIEIVPQSEWEKENADLPPEYLLGIKLRTWKARSFPTTRVGRRNAAGTDAEDVMFLVKIIQAKKQTLLDIIHNESCNVAAAEFVKIYEDFHADLGALGFNLQ